MGKGGGSRDLVPGEGCLLIRAPRRNWVEIFSVLVGTRALVMIFLGGI